MQHKRCAQGMSASTHLEPRYASPRPLIGLTLPLSGRQGAYGGEAQSWWRPVHSRGLFEQIVLSIKCLGFRLPRKRNVGCVCSSSQGKPALHISVI